MGKKKRKPENRKQITAYDWLQIIGAVISFAASVLSLVASILAYIAGNRAN